MSSRVSNSSKYNLLDLYPYKINSLICFMDPSDKKVALGDNTLAQLSKHIAGASNLALIHNA